MALLSHWTLNEASGTRADSQGSNDLGDVNTVTQVTGIINEAAQFTLANSEALTRSSASLSPDLSIGTGDLSVAAWVYLDTTSANHTVISKYDNANGNREWWLATIDNGGSYQFLFRVFNNVATANDLFASTFGALSTDTWYFVAAYVDNTANELGISVNNSAFQTTALTVTPHDGGAVFALGAQNAGAAVFMDGRIDQVRVYNHVLSSSEVTTLYEEGVSSAESPAIFFGCNQ